MDDPVFKALGDPTRRLLLDRLFEHDGQTLGDLEAALPEMTRFGVMKHLRVLESAGLVATRRVGREKHHFLNSVPIRQIHDRWIDKYRARSADALLNLKSALEDQPMSASTAAPDHVFTIFIKTTPDALWRAITESEFTKQYYYSSTVESDWRPGSPYKYLIGDDLAIVGEVVEADRPRRLVSTFDARWDDHVTPDPPSRITWEIEQAGDDLCKLTVVHEGFAARNATYEQVGGGMPFILSGLKTLLETGRPIATTASVRVAASA
jgi:uncharacterized protein YndB with AHSA1/START domain/DNA-binding transcriptional ArsR family regulator